MNGNGNLTLAQVREKLDAGHELFLYKSTRTTFYGWTIDNAPVHGNTVLALIRNREIVEDFHREFGASGIVRRARKRNGGDAR